MFFHAIVKFYAKLFGFIHDRLNYNIRGFGFALRCLKKDTIVELHDFQLYFDHREAEAYSRVIAGEYNEPETHLILNKLAHLMKFHFVEVGGSIGEIMVDTSSQSNVISSVIFEPNPRCYRIINTNVALNALNNVEVVQAACGDYDGYVKMHFGENSPTASVLSQDSLEFGQDVRIVKLDSYFGGRKFHHRVVLLVDVEGFEPQVLNGAITLINNCNPIIIFEYNKDSRKHYHIDRISEICGPNYRIKRLNRFGLLDDDIDNSYNCVAYHVDFEFQKQLFA